MGFWDFILDPGGNFTSSSERVSGTPKRVSGRLRKGGNREVNPWPKLTTFAEELGRRIDSGGETYHNEGGTFKNPNRDRLFSWNDDSTRGQDAGNSVEDILARLQELQDPGRYLGDSGSLTQQAMAMAAAEYDPQIQQLRMAMESANARGNRNKTELGNMFNSLSSSLQGDVPGIQNMYKTDKAESKAGYNDLQQQIKGQYADSAAEQEAMLKRLNIEAAAPDILPEQQRDRDYFTQLAARDAQVEQSALGMEERGAVNYTQQGSQIARSEGTQRQADLMAELQDLLNQYEGQIGGLKSAKNSSYLANLLGLQQQQSSSAIESAQRDFENYIKMIQVGRDLKSDSATTPVGSVKSPADVAARAMGFGLPQNSAQAVQDVFMSAISSDSQILGGMGVLGQSLPKEALAQRVVEAGRQAGLNSQELNALQTAALEYFGRR